MIIVYRMYIDGSTRWLVNLLADWCLFNFIGRVQMIEKGRHLGLNLHHWILPFPCFHHLLLRPHFREQLVLRSLHGAS